MKAFLEKTRLHSSLKGYTGEKAAQNLASKLEGRAFDVYMRLSDADKKDAAKIESELCNAFEKGKLNREIDINELNNRKRQPNESAMTYCYKILQLVNLAYPTFNEDTRQTIAKDYFMRGVHPKMQSALKSQLTFAEANIKELAGETTRLQLAGVTSFADIKDKCSNVNTQQTNHDSEMIETIAAKVVEKMKDASLGAHGGQEDVNSARFMGNRPYSNQRRGQFAPRFNRTGNRGFKRNSPGPAKESQQLKCRACQSPEHLVRNCPTRFCQACGGEATTHGRGSVQIINDYMVQTISRQF